MNEKAIFKKDTIMRIAKLTQDGAEINDPKNLFIPGLRPPISIQDQIKRILRLEVAKQAQLAEYEDMEEADDFDIEGEFDADAPGSPYILMSEDNLATPRLPQKSLHKEPEKPNLATEDGAPKEPHPEKT